MKTRTLLVILGIVVVLSNVGGLLVGMRVRGVSRDIEEMRRAWYEEEVSRIDSMVMMIEMERKKDEIELDRMRGGLDSMRASWAKSRGEVKSIEEWFKNKKGGLQ